MLTLTAEEGRTFLREKLMGDISSSQYFNCMEALEELNRKEVTTIIVKEVREEESTPEFRWMKTGKEMLVTC